MSTSRESSDDRVRSRGTGRFYTIPVQGHFCRAPSVKLPLRILLLVAAFATSCPFLVHGADDVRSPLPLTSAQLELLKQRDALQHAAEELVQHGKIQESIVEVQKMLVIERAVHGNEHDEVIGSLQSLRDLSVTCGDFAGARKFGEELLTIQIKRFGQDDWRVTDERLEIELVGQVERLSAADRERLTQARTSFDAADALNKEGKTSEALEKTRAVLDVYRELLGNRHQATASLLDYLATLHRLQRENENARSSCENAIEIRKEVLGIRHPDYAESLNNLAVIYYSSGEFAQAEPLYRQAFEIRKSVCGEGHPACLSYLENIALLFSAQGDFAKSIQVREEIRNLTKRTQGDQTLRYATALNDLALIHDTHGDYVSAEPLYRNAVSIAAKIDGDEAAADHAMFLHNLARLHYSQADFSTAKSLYIKALSEIKRIHGDRDTRYSLCLNNLAITTWEQRDLATAESYCRQALEIRRQTLGELNPPFAASLNVLAAILDDQKKYAESESLCRQAVTIVKQKQYEPHPELPSYLNNLAMVLRAQGKNREAEPLFREALEVWKRQLGEQHPSYAMALTNLSTSLQCLGRHDEALQCARQAAEIQRDNVEAVAAIQSERQQFLSTRYSRDALDALVSVLDSRRAPVSADYDQVLQMKGRVWQRQWSARAAMHAATSQPEIGKLADELRSLSARRAKLTFTPPPDASDHEKWRTQLAEIVDLQEACERRLFEKSAAIRASRRPVTTDDLRRHLPKGTVLVDFLEYSRTQFDASKLPCVVYENRLAAFIIRSDRTDVEFVDLDAIKPLAVAIDTWRLSCGISPAARTAGQYLRSTIWQPLEPHLKDCQLVVVSPDGVLGKFPLGALPGKSKDTYLLEEIPLAVLPCMATLPQMLAPDHAFPHPEVTGNLLVLANVDYDSVAEPQPAEIPRKFGRQIPAVRGAEWKRYKPLDGTRGELAAIEKLYRDIVRSKAITLLEGSQARKDRFCVEAPRHKFLHVATHGFFAPSSLKSMLQVENDRERSATPLENIASFPGYPPGLLSGLVFAGANRTPMPGQDDGILTASEVEQLDLRGVQLAVLSACETGLGEVAGGEGLLGLQRAFQVAGTQSVVASLWEVSDTATRSLMERFYDNLLRKRMGTLESLREAQLWMLRERQNRGLVRIDEPENPGDPGKAPPFYWAAFVLSGDWR